jgi:hypothetical protein
MKCPQLIIHSPDPRSVSSHTRVACYCRIGRTLLQLVARSRGNVRMSAALRACVLLRPEVASGCRRCSEPFRSVTWMTTMTQPIPTEGFEEPPRGILQRSSGLPPP